MLTYIRIIPLLFLFIIHMDSEAEVYIQKGYWAGTDLGFLQLEDMLDLLEGFNHVFQRLYLWVIYTFAFII